MYTLPSIILAIRVARPEFKIYFDNFDLSLRHLHSVKNKCHFESVVVDYGSSKEYENKIFMLCKHYNHKYVRSEAACWSRSRALNIGIHNSTGDRLFFIDADTLIPENYIYKHLEIANNKNVTISLVYDSQVESIEDKIASLPNLATLPGEIRKQGFSHFSVEKDWLLQHKGYDSNYVGWGGEDDDILLRMATSGLKKVFIDSTPVHLWHPQYSDIMSSIGKYEWYKKNLETNRRRYNDKKKKAYTK